MRVGNDNLFQSTVFSNTISTILGNQIEVIETTGAVGAAKAAGVGIGHYKDLSEAMQNTKILQTYSPQNEQQTYRDAYQSWLEDFNKTIVHEK